MATYTVTVQLRTSDGRPLCDAAEDGGTYVFAAMTEEGTLSDEFVCPQDTLVVENVPEGEYVVGFLRNTLVPLDGERIPQFWIDGFYTVDAEESFNVRLGGIKEIRGRALFEGDPNPFARISFEADAELPTIEFGADENGEWVDPELPTVPALLQKEITYTATCRGGLGTRTISFEYNLSETRKAVCRSPESRFASVSHTSSRIALSTEPAMLHSGLLDDEDTGTGWGVQFNESGNPSTSEEANLLYKASLALGLDDGTVLTGTEVGACEVCQDFSNILNVKHDRYSEGRRVTWVYDDSDSEEGVGLRVVQRSYDGNGLDYVLFHYAFENRSGDIISFHPGVFFDWDIGDASDNSGGTELEGRLMYVTDPDGDYPFMGTVIITPEPAGNFFHQPGDATSEDAQLAFLRGDARRVSSSDMDVSYFHSATELTIDSGEKRGMWIAVVGGNSLDDIIANANYAIDDVTGGDASIRTDAGITFEDEADTQLPLLEWSTRKAVSGGKLEACEARKPKCKREAPAPSLEQLQNAARVYFRAMKK